VQALLAHDSQFEEPFLRGMLERWRTPEGRYFESFRRVLMAF
jgi:hypothetical protein